MLCNAMHTWKVSMILKYLKNLNIYIYICINLLLYVSVCVCVFSLSQLQGRSVGGLRGLAVKQAVKKGEVILQAGRYCT